MNQSPADPPHDSGWTGFSPTAADIPDIPKPQPGPFHEPKVYTALYWLVESLREC